MIFQKIIYDIKFFSCLAREQMGVPLCHGQRIVAHKLFQLKERNFSRLREPRRKSMSNRMKCNTVRATRGCIPNNLYRSFKSFRNFTDGTACATFLKDGFARSTFIGKQHGYNGLRGMYGLTLSTFRCDMQDTGSGIYVFPLQLENFGSPESCFQGQQGHIVKLWAALRQFVEEYFRLGGSKETESSVIDLGHLPAALTGDRIDAVPAVGTNGVVNDSAQKAEMMMDALRTHHLTGEFVSYRRQHPGCDAGDGNSVNPRTDVFIILLERFIDVFALSACPRNICVYGVANSNGFVDNRVASGVQFRKELDAGCSGCLYPHALAMASDSLPVQLLEWVEVREAVYPVIVSSAWVTLGGDTIVYALELCGDVFALVLCHVEYVRNSRHMGQAFIHFLSIQEKSGYRFHDNRLISFGGTCGGRTCDSLLKRQILYLLS